MTYKHSEFMSAPPWKKVPVLNYHIKMIEIVKKIVHRNYRVNIYLFKVALETLEKDVKYVQS